MSPLDVGAHITHTITTAHGITELRTLDGLHWATCWVAWYRAERDEDDVTMRCRWRGPDRDRWEDAWQDAITHIHDEGWRCFKCEECKP